jgi:hypothetical protein
LSPISETGASSRALTPKRPRSPIPAGVDKASSLKRRQASEAPEAFGSESSAEIRPERANWMFGGKLAKLGGDLKGNPFKAMVDLVDHEKLHMKRDVSARGMAEEMLTMHFLVSTPTLCCYSCNIHYHLILCFPFASLPQIGTPLLLLQEGLGY